MIAHMSDTHLGAMPYGLKERSEDFYDVFNEAIDIITKDHIGTVVHSGDIFDSPKPTGLAVKNLYEGLKRLESSGSRMLFVLGEHDISRVKDVPFPLLLGEMGFATYIGDGVPHEFDGITFTGFSKHRRSEINALREKLAGLKRGAGKNVLVLHQGLVEFNYYAGEITTADLPDWFDYYAMGHLHDHDEKRFAGINGDVCYAGSTDASGFCIVDLSGETKVEWVKLEQARKAMKFTVDYQDMEKGVESIMKEISGLRKKPVVSVTVVGREVNRAGAMLALKPVYDASLFLQTGFRETAVAAGTEEKPADLRAEMLTQAERILGKAGKFAVSELLPEAGDEDAMSERMWRAFEGGELD